MTNYTFLSATILLILITDPIGNISIFANALKHVPPERRPWVISREICSRSPSSRTAERPTRKMIVPVLVIVSCSG